MTDVNQTLAHSNQGSSGAVLSTSEEGQTRIFPCDACGADLSFSIGAQQLKCPHCGHEKELSVQAGGVVEQDFQAMLAKVRENRAVSQVNDKEVTCGSCGANVVFAGELTSLDCAYCATPIQRGDVHQAKTRVPVDGVLPFMVKKDKASERLKTWVKSRWFAPGDWKKRGVSGQFSGVYLPYWTYDSATSNFYQGERGDAYYVEVGSGDNKRRERRIRWSSASGSFQRFFDDVMVAAVKRLSEKYLSALEPWPFDKLLPFNHDVMAGYLAQTYDRDLEEGFGIAKGKMDAAIRAEVKKRIGGDEQRIHVVNTNFDGITYKHLLLPVWLLGYKYGGKIFQVMINACTGEVQGERPWSKWKIALAVLAGIAGVGAIVLLKGKGG
jgi:predicted RNA-binding Zn-ribbon protein involved in translation (DUF1610 family)